MADETVDTRTALEIAGIGIRDWSNAVHRGHYKHAPRTVQGRAAQFTVDDIVAARVLGVFLSVGATTFWAATVAHQVIEAMAKDPTAKQLTVWRVERDGKPDLLVQTAEPPGGSKVIVLPIAEYQRDVRRALREKFRQEGA